MNKFIVTMAMCFGTYVQAAVTVNELNLKLANEKALWRAKENWVSKLSEVEIKKMMGSQELPGKSLDYSKAYKGQLTYEEIDWRNVDGINWLGDVMNQGNCGSCVAFAAIATLEAQTSITSKAPWLKPFYSPQALFACGGGTCERGWIPSIASSYLTQKGAVEASCAPYLSGSTGEDVACHQFCNDQTSRTHAVKRSYNPSGFGRNIQAVKDALKKGPLMTTMTVYSDFVSYSSGIYRSTSTQRLGGHAISLVGYNDAGRYWIIRNSWGSDWGENGFARISWDDKSGVGNSTIGFDLAATSHIAIVSPKEGEYLSGAVDLKALTQNDSGLQFKFKKLAARDASVLSCQSKGGECVTTLDTQNLGDGQYEMWAENKDGSVKSLVRPFAVLNSEPALSISFTPVGGVDLNRPLKDRIELNVTTTAAPVPAQSLEFLVLKLDGQVALRRSFEVVLPKMKLGFRTNAIANGDYEIFYKISAHAAGRNYSSESEHHRVLIRN